MRKRNLVITIVTGLVGAVAAALVLSLSAPVNDAAAQVVEIERHSLDSVSTVYISATGTGLAVLQIQGTDLDGLVESSFVRFDPANERQKWAINKCYQQAMKVMSQNPNKTPYTMNTTCYKEGVGSCDLTAGETRILCQLYHEDL